MIRRGRRRQVPERTLLESKRRRVILDGSELLLAPYVISVKSGSLTEDPAFCDWARFEHRWLWELAGAVSRSDLNLIGVYKQVEYQIVGFGRLWTCGNRKSRDESIDNNRRGDDPIRKRHPVFTRGKFDSTVKIERLSSFNFQLSSRCIELT